MMSRVVLLLLLATFVCTRVSLAAPGDPFGGDDAGCFPLNKNAAKCENAVAKAASKALACIMKCHVKRADGSLANDAAEDACESTDPKSCKAKYDAATGPTSKINALCPPCLPAAARASVYAAIESQLDGGTNAAVYCSSGGGAFGGDDAGFLPAAKSNDQKCEDAVAKAVAKASACIMTCGMKLAGGKLVGDPAEDACEGGASKSCKVKYDAATGPTSKINGLCPACLDSTARANQFASTEAQLDALSGLFYCCELPTTTTTSTTSTTLPSGGGVVLKGALTATLGRFNYNLTLGLPGANSACNTNFTGTHACTYTELQAAQTAGDLVNLKDTALSTVTSFWAIDGAQPALQQCNDDALGGSGLNWEYGTAHTPSRGQRVPLTNATGSLGALATSIQCNIAGTSWVGCCQ